MQPHYNTVFNLLLKNTKDEAAAGKTVDFWLEHGDNECYSRNYLILFNVKSKAYGIGDRRGTVGLWLLGQGGER